MKKYMDLYIRLRDMILNGTYAPSAQLPTESELASGYAVSRQTVRQALENLRSDGLIYSVRGSGSFVAPGAGQSPDNRRIAVITTYFSEYIFPSILRGISDTTMERGYTLELSATNNSISTERAVLNTIQKGSVAGVIVEGTKSALPNPNITYYQNMAASGIPIVFIHSIYPQLEGENIISVMVDDYRGGYLLAKRLIDSGHRRIGCIFKNDDAQGLNRFAGVMAALVDTGTSFDDRDFLWFTTETKYSALQTLSSSPLLSDCTGLVCYNDEIAELLSSRLSRDPGQVRAVVSFDRDMNPELFASGVSFYSLGHPKEQLGRTAAGKLFDIINGQKVRSVLLPWEE